MSKNNEIWIYAEKAGDAPASVYRELLLKAVEMKENIPDAAVCGIVLGDENEQYAEDLKKEGADRIYVLSHSKLGKYDVCTYGTAFAQAVKEHAPLMVLFGATEQGAELAPTVAAKLRTGLAAHCVDIQVTPERINCMVPAFGGRVVSEIYIPDARPIMASVRPGILDVTEIDLKPTEDLVNISTAFLDDFQSPVKLLSFEPSKPTEGIPLEEAEIVVCAGRGVATQESWNDLQELAARLGAAVGYTRSFADLGFVPDESDMIGTSGKSVKPAVFLGFGISGAVHHTRGMSKSKTVISINRDEKAKMFGISDYGVVQDAGKMLKALLKKTI